MTIKSAIDARSVLLKLSDKCIKAKTSYIIMKILKETEDTEKFYVDKVNGLLNQHAEKDDNGKFKIVNNGIVLKPGSEQEFDKAMHEIESLEVDDISRRILLSDLEGLDVSPKDLGQIDFLITED